MKNDDTVARGLAQAESTKTIEVGRGVLADSGRILADTLLAGGRPALLVADERTWAAAGDAVEERLRRAGARLAEPMVFPGSPTLYASYDNCEEIRERLRETGALGVAVGSGTVNDLVKLASGELRQPYAVVATAASMDGYTGFGAPMTRGGLKITMPCPAPLAVIFDLDVAAAAPRPMAASGYGDLSAKIPAGADWLLAHALGIEPINEYVWDMVQGPLRGSLADPEAIGNGDKKAIEGLMEGNLMSGLAMQAGQSSRSASGAGHQFSHTWEMEGHGLDWEPPLSHGFKVGIGTIASCAIWEEFLAMEAEDFDVDRALAAVKTPEQVESEVRAALKPRMQDEAVRHSLKKRTEGEELVARIELLKEKWPELRERLRVQLMAPGEVMDRLKTVGAPYHPELIEIDWDRFRQTHFKAQMIRDRYTVLDILVDLGVYGDVVERLFSPEGFWGRHRHPSA